MSTSFGERSARTQPCMMRAVAPATVRALAEQTDTAPALLNGLDDPGSLGLPRPGAMVTVAADTRPTGTRAAPPALSPRHKRAPRGPREDRARPRLRAEALAKAGHPGARGRNDSADTGPLG